MQKLLKEICFYNVLLVLIIGIDIIDIFKACVHYFSTNFHFSPNDSLSKTMKDVFYFIQKLFFAFELSKFLYFHLPLFFSLSVIALELDPR